MTVYHTERPAEPGLATGQIPARRRRRLLAGALVILALLALLGNMLLVEAYLHAEFAENSAPRAAHPFDAVPAAVRTGGPVIDLSGSRPRSYRMPARTIALTFDDGPDARWTPRVLEVLRRHRVHGTFFVIGSQVARIAVLSRQIVAEGHEIGAHTFTHPRVSTLPAWLRGLEHSATQEAIAYTTGRSTSLYRPPYSSVADALDNTDVPPLRELGHQGYRTVLNDLDSQDWQRPGGGPG
jgi:peptidoglycan/xylan/chitin deacetylase (PgdA/CDA1 family)